LTVQANGGTGVTITQGKRCEGYINGSSAFVKSAAEV
jgi:hypothetical protein